MTQAAPVALFAVGSAAAVGAIDGLRYGLVRYRAALLIAALGAVFSPLGIYFAHQLPEKILMILFSLLYGIISYTFSYYGELFPSLGMTMSMAAFEVHDLYGFGNWKSMQKRQAV